jgi:hypothetical protein
LARTALTAHDALTVTCTAPPPLSEQVFGDVTFRQLQLDAVDGHEAGNCRQWYEVPASIGPPVVTSQYCT